MIQCEANEKVFGSYQELYREQCTNFRENNNGAQSISLQSEVVQGLKTESAIAGALLGFAENKLFDKVKSIFFISNDLSKTSLKDIFDSLKQNDYKDPYLTFDPKKDIKDVSLSPVGIVQQKL